MWKAGKIEMVVGILKGKLKEEICQRGYLFDVFFSEKRFHVGRQWNCVYLRIFFECYCPSLFCCLLSSPLVTS
jgi:hypothetical protein